MKWRTVMVVSSVIAVSALVAFYVVRSRDSLKKVGAPTTSASGSASALSGTLKPPEIPWVPVGKLADAAGEWADPCGPNRTEPGDCGSHLVIVSRAAAQKRDPKYRSIYPWKLELKTPKMKTPVVCGLHKELTMAPDSAPVTESWRAGFCKGGGLGVVDDDLLNAIKAERVMLLFRGVLGGTDNSKLRARVGYLDEITFTRVPQ